MVPPEALAGGRSTDGKVWVENIADDIGATLMDYAVSTTVGYHCGAILTHLAAIAIWSLYGFAPVAERDQAG